ncbi:MAG: ParB/RepB/Spo0J family partition protein [Ignavibacteriota bacterium]|nr:MAG: ParB/RepB/Spo0J family partition protein [Chlorobiota bacterium]MBE7478028.1 ParB/RepB/Spo0J family partition protein [Ignavibacteriales bacterium]MBL1123440.1 ParB/RepB/Spo0J family partition protein [Ignavibacteriota bacterium]MCC7094526.1 ParB/RepB/Spo0J family partition protein [Ignavibacteriaceae bacterium]MCE7856615.1 ParB/RepB/Spo0J family partition protein [Ignavibacteria bacterium CHB3]MEB2296144.1 ParB/RepB/Spo0J family partition protein [Ignavibacteria bacterium]
MKTGLGRGLDALIKPQEYIKNTEQNVDLSRVKDDDGKQIDVLAKIAVEFVSRNPYQPRFNIDPVSLDELKKSILTNGLIQPITVRRTPDHKYQLISGERRLQACKEIGFKEIPAYIIDVDSDELMLALALIENIQREKLNAIEVGTAYKRLMDECHLTQEQIAERVGKDRTTVANTIRLLKLPQKIQDALAQDKITSGHARALINLDNEPLQLQLLDNILSKNLSVRKVERLVRELNEGGTRKINKTQTNDDVKATFYTPNLRDVEDKLRVIFGTKVKCVQRKDGTGEITLEYYSKDEFERLIELFEIITKNYN